MHLPRLEIKAQVRGFLGLTGCYRRFIPDYATVAAPLTDLTQMSAPNIVQWSDACNHAFDELKNRLCKIPILSSPDFLKPFILQTDASDRGTGAVLSQIGEDGKEHPVGFNGRKFQSRGERYSTVEKECLTMKLVISAFRVYLLRRKFMIQTSSFFGMAGQIKGEQPSSVVGVYHSSPINMTLYTDQE